MEFGVLGPLAVTTDGDGIQLRSTKQRILLAMLLSHANTPVSQRRLLEALWDVPPASATENLRLYVHQLRKALGNGNRIARTPSGYAMTVHPGELDAQVFDSDAAEGSRMLAAGDPERASQVLSGALSLWRGAAYGDLADTPVIRQAALRLEEARLRAVEERIAADLSLGRHAEQVAELMSLTEAYPYREPLRAHLMRALYGAGRQAEALDVYRRTRAVLIEQLGIEPGPELRRLHAAILRGEQAPLDRAEQVPVRAEIPCPYRGLMAFEPADKRWFFGRAHLVERLLGRVERNPVVTVLGASGSGKSSLLRAGLLGALSDDAGWHTVLLTPTEHPLAALDDALTSVPGARPDPCRTLIVVDQFEEVFTLCAEVSERDRFIDTLLAESLRATVVLGVRADFLAHLTRHPGLVSTVEDALLVGPPSSADLREIIVRPAEQAGLTVDPDLLATILADVGAEPGALPLLSHALLETSRNRTGNSLTLPAYQASGGVRGAIAQSAERVYDELSDAERQAARLIFLRLTALGSGTEDTRRRVTRSELDGIAEPEVIDAVLARLAAARLIVLGEQAIEVAHEALIRAWPRLHRWLFDDRAHLLTHRRLTAAAQTWRELDEDPGALYRGAQLGIASAWADEHLAELNTVESAFLEASLAGEERERVTARRRGRLLGRLVATLAVLLVLAVVGTGIAVWQRREAQLGQQIELSHQLALTARQVLDTAPDLAGLLAIEAYRRHPDPDTLGALLSSASAARRRVELNVGGPSVFDVAVNADGTLLASSNRIGTVDVWDLARHTLLFSLTEHTSMSKDPYAHKVAFDHSGRLIASSAREAGLDATPGSLVVWDATSRKPVFQQRFELLTNGMAISPDGTVVAVGTGGGPVEVWDVRTRTHRVLAGHRFEVDSIAISPGGRFLVSANDKEDPIVWDLATGTRLGTVPAAEVSTVVFGSEGDELTTSSIRHGIHFWNLDSGSALPAGELPLQASYAWDISAPMGGRIAVADEYGLITIWDLRRRVPIETYQDRGRAETRALTLGRDGTLLASGGLGRTLTVREIAIPPFTGHGGGVNDLTISPNGTLVASAGADRTVRLWDPTGKTVAVLGEHADRVEAVAWSPDGRQLAALTRNHTITIWDVEHRTQVKSFAYNGMGTSTDIAYSPDQRNLVTSASGRFRFNTADFGERKFPSILIATALAFTPDGRFLISTDPAGNVLFWDWAADREAFHVKTGQGDIRDVAVSHDGTRVATAGADRTVKLWNTRDGSALATLVGHTAPAQVLAFSPDDRVLASAGEDRTVITWDLGTRARTATLTGHPTPVQALTFTPNGDLLSGSERIIRYTLGPDAAITRICAEVARNLTPEEWSANLGGEAYRSTCA